MTQFVAWLGCLVILGGCSDPEIPGSGGALGHPAGVVAATVPLGGGPFGLAVSSQGVVYVTRGDAAAVTTGSTASLTLGASIAVGPVPTNVAFDPAGAMAYVANQGSAAVGVVDVGQGIQLVQVPIGGDPFNVAVSPSGTTVYAATNVGSVYAISTATRNVTDSVNVPIAASSMVFGRGDTLLYVSSFLGGAVSEISVKAKMTVRRTFATGGTPQGMAVSPDGSTLYVANEAGWLNAIDLAGGTITTPLNLPGGPFGLALTPDGTQLYVTLVHSGGIAVVDRLTVTVDKVIAAGLTPRRVGFSPDGLTAAVADEAGFVVFIR